ncbi:hypothetical protein GLAREA_05162 [Glarea lozoyensis ATCC 20868]|uniref:Uncharacterized protein n=1 Tax=Glarea lozoyensis (strain ATCC 20868 / MF5171) TaxID=1116229 RepID=S3DFF2_GLAL2|nr:uncharacterized protein GLAREA_05162 [Glarea lozoyensis ATCC 20868]EPE35824.1 hypothetical protein GLAREA_05162 [Glarea lozoyensis ATCC 20868]
MAIFDELPLELQESIWKLVIPSHGGIHWIDVEGFPRSTAAILRTLARVKHHFDDKERDSISIRGPSPVVVDDWEYWCYVRDKVERGDPSTPFFDHLYPIVPSVWGRAGPGPKELDIIQDFSDEVAAVGRCRQLSTYTQISSLLSTCKSSRWTAFRWLEREIPGEQWRLFRGEGLMCRPRHLSVWKEQYQTSEPPEKQMEAEELVPGSFDDTDLVILRLHTTSGHLTTTMKHSFFQLNTEDVVKQPSMIPNFKRAGIEWNPVWATEGGVDICNISAFESANRLTAMYGAEHFYWLIDGIPRPQWEQYPSCIPAAYSFLIDTSDLKYDDYNTVNRLKPGELIRAPGQHDLYHDLEANGRRYYIVFMFTNHGKFDSVDGYDAEIKGTFLQTNFPDPRVCWADLFPGGKDLWPKALHDPVEFADKHYLSVAAGRSGTYFLSWEPI